MSLKDWYFIAIIIIFSLILDVIKLIHKLCRTLDPRLCDYSVFIMGIHCFGVERTFAEKATH